MPWWRPFGSGRARREVAARGREMAATHQNAHDAVRRGIIRAMNLLLLLDQYRQHDGLWRVSGSRARHIREVLACVPGDRLRAGLPQGRRGFATVEAVDGADVLVSFVPDAPPPPPLPLQLILALPRPKMLKRILVDATSLGIKRIVLLNSWKVDKSYWRTPNLRPAQLEEKLVLGLEQAGDTVLPEILLRERFRPFVEDELDAFAAGTRRLLAHPGDHPPLPVDLCEPVTLAVGPEGGWTPYEVEQFQQHGFACHSLGQRILRVETAVPALVGRLMRLP